MKKIVLAGIFAGLLLIPLAGHSQQSETGVSSNRSFLQTNAWWNLYFAQENNPLRRGDTCINAVKVLEIDQNRPSWIKVTFPKSREDHLSIFGPVAKVRDKGGVAFDVAMAKWEKTVSDWKTMWVNLDFVVYMTKVQPSGPTNPDSAPLRRDR